MLIAARAGISFCCVSLKRCARAPDSHAFIDDKFAAGERDRAPSR